MKQVETELKKINPGMVTKIIIADFSGNANLEFYKKISQQLDDIDMSILILNAGVLGVGSIEESSAKSQQEMIDTNVYHVVILAKLLLPRLQSRKNGAFIVNSSSGYLKCFPGSVVYTATKAFLTQWTEGIAIELKNSNVDVQCLCPNGTRTNII